MVINTNIAALTSANNLDGSTNALNESLSRLSSGSKIVNASDDPAGLAESMELNQQIGETTAGNANVSNALEFSQTQDGYLQQVSAALNQMATLAVSAQDPTKSTAEVADYQSQFLALQNTIQSSLSAMFNGTYLFGSSTNLAVAAGNATTVQLTAIDPSTNANDTAAQTAWENVTGWVTGTNGGAPTLTATPTDTLTTTPATTLSDVQSAISTLATARGTVGANEELLTYAGNELGVLSNNLSAAKSTITDVDVAAESTNYAKEQILVQSGTAMLAQANQNPQSILKLLQ
jgi:flagellin